MNIYVFQTFRIRLPYIHYDMLWTLEAWELLDPCVCAFIICHGTQDFGCGSWSSVFCYFGLVNLGSVILRVESRHHVSCLEDTLKLTKAESTPGGMMELLGQRPTHILQLASSIQRIISPLTSIH